MVADEQWYVAVRGGIEQPFARFEGMGDGLFHQGRDAGRDAFERLVDVQLVGRRENHAVRTAVAEQLIEGSVEPDASPLGNLLCSGTGIDDGRQAAAFAGLDQFDMAAADEPCAGDCKLDLSHDLEMVSAAQERDGVVIRD
ncbi:hypothetical protein WJ07_04655 [Burkholderia vietnamiensis]|nr:hypothetical protein WJ07_04655 [Burkholderia vietnamiensis]